MNESKIIPFQSGVVSVRSCCNSGLDWINVGAPGCKAKPLQTGNLLRSVFRIHGITSQLTTAATLPLNLGCRFSHSKTLVFGLGILRLLSMRGSATPVRNSL